MKFISLYSESRFKAFTYEEQIKALNKLISALEENLTSLEHRSQLIEHLLKLSLWVEKPLPERMRLFLIELNPQISPHQLYNKLYFYQGGALRKDSQIPLKEGNMNISADPHLRQKAKQITVICDNLRSVFNVGSIFRTCECLGIGQIILCGISPTPNHSNMPKTAMGTEKLVAWQYFDKTSEAIAFCHQTGLCVYALETLEKAKSVFETVYNLPLAIVIGNEALGIDPSFIELCDEFITLPQLGWKNSLNVGVATGITLYQILWGGTNG
ncbi:MAG: TrmH family RNA methyltransferase [Candidatus Cloacimonas sp.]